MPIPAEVHIHYAAYEAFGIVEHCLVRLTGMKKMLESNGHTIKFFQTPDIRDLVELYVNDEKIFECNIKNLDFGGDGQMDPLCHLALIAVNEAY